MLYEAHGISKFIVVCGYTDLRKGISGLARSSKVTTVWIRLKRTPCFCFAVNVVIGSRLFFGKEMGSFSSTRDGKMSSKTL